MAAPPSPYPPVLMDELVEQFLLLLPPEDPADLARAALVSKQWHRVATGAVFRRRYIEFHRSPPLLGYIFNLEDSISFVPMSSFRPPQADRRDVEAIHASHGRVLLRSTRDWKTDDINLFVWDPITDKQWELPVLLATPGRRISDWDAAVVCAVGDGCSHLDCHFKVVVVGVSRERTLSCFYSSESDSWSDPIFAPGRRDGGYYPMQVCVRAGNDLYFWRTGSKVAVIMFKYDLLTNQMCTISVNCEAQAQLTLSGLLIATEDGRLGIVKAVNSTLRLWLKEHGRWAESRVIQLPPEVAEGRPCVSGFAETGTGVIFLHTCVGFFAVDLNSGRSKKVGECFGSIHIFPYVSFCTPALGTVSTDEGPGAGVAVSTDDKPGAGVAISRDKGPGHVAFSSDEGPGPSMSSA